MDCGFVPMMRMQMPRPRPPIRERRPCASSNRRRVVAGGGAVISSSRCARTTTGDHRRAPDVQMRDIRALNPGVKSPDCPRVDSVSGRA